MSVLAGVEADIARLPVEMRDSGLAAIARAMASRIDEGRGSPSECGKVAIDALVKLRELAPPVEKKGKLYAINEGRNSRLAEGQPGS